VSGLDEVLVGRERHAHVKPVELREDVVFGGPLDEFAVLSVHLLRRDCVAHGRVRELVEDLPTGWCARCGDLDPLHQVCRPVLVTLQRLDAPVVLGCVHRVQLELGSSRVAQDVVAREPRWDLRGRTCG
jgi:hypothetical protein